MVAPDDLKLEYMQSLVREMEYYNDLLAKVETVYIGGGTPSSLDLGLLDAFLHELSLNVNLEEVKEFTFETNPCDVSQAYLDLLKKYHVSRISMGVQSMDEGLLKFLGRTHTKDVVIEAVKLVKKSGFVLNLDFLYAIPGQTQEMLMTDIDFIKKFDPEHISYYSLIVEDKTILNYLINNHKVSDFSDDLARDFADIVDQKLKDFGYNKYEISNYCKIGFASKHNLLYWDLEEYIGLGLNASSQFNNVRMKNPRRIREYIDGSKKHALNMHTLEEYDQKSEFLLMGLRKTAGISLDTFKQKTKIDVLEAYPELKKHLDNKLLEIVDGYLRFTNEGMYLSNQVYLDII
jgi:oxygen-independent coproporphyrinogen-3 oxidase